LAETINGNYIGYSSNTNFNANGNSKTIGGSDYKDVKAKNGGILNMDSGISSYSFRKLEVVSGSTLNLTPGDYYVEELEVSGTSTLNVVGDGTARIWVSKKAKFKDTSTVNGGASGDPAKLFVYFDGSGEDKLKVESGALVAAYLYSAKKIEFNGSSKFYGAATAQGELIVKGSAEVINTTGTLDNADFGDVCEVSINSLDHYRYEYDGSALTCATETIVVKACANEDCSSLYEQSSNIDFRVTADGSTVSTSLAFTEFTTITLGESSEQTLSLSSGASSPSSGLKCYQNSELDENCDFKVEDTGFIFINTDTGEQQIADQISGKGSNEGFNPINVALQAVQTDTTTGACVPLFSDEAGVEVLLSHQCVNPGSCLTSSGDENALKLSNDDNTYALSHYPDFASHILQFDPESKAAFTINYPDAGKIKLHAQMSIVLDEDETTLMSGSSNEFIVRPFGLSLVAQDYVKAADNTAAAYKMAGEDFGLTVSARQWQAVDDCDVDGFADIAVSCGGGSQTADLSDNGMVLNFGQEDLAQGVIVSTVVVNPASGDNPSLAGANFSGFNGGYQTNNVHWDNVGIVDLVATLDADGKYLGTEGVAGVLTGVGRFVPSHYKLNSSSLIEGCGQFSYMGQSMTLGLEIEALGVGDISLSNYDSSSQLVPAEDREYQAFASIGLVAENGNDGIDLGARIDPFSYLWVDVVLSGLYDVGFALAIEAVAPSVDGSYDEVKIGVVIDGGDSVDLNFVNDDLTMNALTSGDCSVGGNCTGALLNLNSASFRFGRLTATAVYGPQGNDLSLPISTEYWSGSRFVTATNDNCSSIQVEQLTISNDNSSSFEPSYDVLDPSDNSEQGNTTIITSTATTTSKLSAVDGLFDLTFGAPNIVGIVPVEIDIFDYPWVQYDWSTNGTGAVETTVPVHNASFGQFRGNDRVIYWREKF
jgi:MSHA biogenesis protein MshQ